MRTRRTGDGARVSPVPSARRGRPPRREADSGRDEAAERVGGVRLRTGIRRPAPHLLLRIPASTPPVVVVSVASPLLRCQG